MRLPEGWGGDEVTGLRGEPLPIHPSLAEQPREPRVVVKSVGSGV